jgi:hypothetical protein
VKFKQVFQITTQLVMTGVSTPVEDSFDFKDSLSHEELDEEDKKHAGKSESNRKEACNIVRREGNAFYEQGEYKKAIESYDKVRLVENIITR